MLSSYHGSRVRYVIDRAAFHFRRMVRKRGVVFWGDGWLQPNGPTPWIASRCYRCWMLACYISVTDQLPVDSAVAEFVLPDGDCPYRSTDPSVGCMEPEYLQDHVSNYQLTRRRPDYGTFRTSPMIIGTPIENDRTQFNRIRTCTRAS